MSPGRSHGGVRPLPRRGRDDEAAFRQALGSWSPQTNWAGRDCTG
jgi:hypothetical protein